jgi:hypothetical protein
MYGCEAARGSRRLFFGKALLGRQTTAGSAVELLSDGLRAVRVSVNLRRPVRSEAVRGRA